MKILIDMNLPPRWASFLAAHGISASHWSVEGDMKAPDSEILRWARERNYVVLIALEKHREALDQGALLSIRRQTSLVRVLPIKKAVPRNCGEVGDADSGQGDRYAQGVSWRRGASISTACA